MCAIISPGRSSGSFLVGRWRASQNRRLILKNSARELYDTLSPAQLYNYFHSRGCRYGAEKHEDYGNENARRRRNMWFTITLYRRLARCRPISASRELSGTVST